MARKHLEMGLIMMNLRSLSLRQLLLIGFSLPIITSVLATVAVLSGYDVVKNESIQAVRSTNERVSLVGTLRANVHSLMKASTNSVLFADHDLRQLERGDFDDALKQYDRTWTGFTAPEADMSSEYKAVQDRLNALRKDTESVLVAVWTLGDQDQFSLASSSLRYMGEPSLVQWQQALAELMAMEQRRVELSITGIQESAGKKLMWMLVMMSFAAGLMTLVALFIMRQVSWQLGGDPREVVEAAAAVEQGDFESKILPINANPNSLLASIERMRLSLKNVVTQLSGTPFFNSQSGIDFAAIEQAVQSQREGMEMADRAASLTRAILHNASIGMATANPAIDGTFQEINTSMCRLLRRDILDLGWESPQNMIHPDDLLSYGAAVTSILAGMKESDSLKLRFTRPGAESVWVDLLISGVRNEDGVLVQLILQAIDITDRLAADRAKSEFIACVSHELRTPLTAIMGSLSLVQGVMGPSMPDKMSKLLGTAQSNASRLLRLINDILDIDKIMAGGMKLELSPQSLHALISQALEANSGLQQRFGVHLEARLAPSDMQVNIDPHRFIQVMSNLLSNAAKFSNTDGCVLVSTQLNAEFARILVQDFGQGIPPAHHQFIFTKFHQGDASVSRKKGGTGLGLFICKEMVVLMGGRIGFDSVEGEGTTFWVDLPFIKTKSESPIEITQMATGGTEIHEVM